jgi:5-methylcytosine-specific restriction endonuclease McrA
MDASYLDYMQSEEWKRIKMLRLQFDCFQCVNCGSKVGLQVHHKHYRNLYNENIKEDLVTLCDRCHDKRTGISRRRRFVITDCS